MKFRIVVSIILSQFTVVAAVADSSVTIGVITDLSGVASYYGEQTRVGVTMAARQLEAQGKRVKVIIEDSSLDTKKGISAAQKLLFVDKVDAVYVDFTPIATAVSAVVERSGKLLFYSAAAESIVRNNKHAFKSYQNYSQGCRAVAEQFKRQGIKQMGVLKAEAEYGELCSGGVKEVYPDSIELSYQRGDVLTTQLLTLKRLGVEAVINGCFEGDLVNTFHAAQKLNYSLLVGSAEDTMTPELMRRFGSQTDGSLTFGLVRIPHSLAAEARKIPGGERLRGMEGTGLSYFHIQQIYWALQNCDNIDCTIAELNAAKPIPEIGFLGWQNRVALFKTIIKRVTQQRLEEVSAYVAR